MRGAQSDEVYRTVLRTPASLVMGLGRRVYLGAPVATPLEPRHRLGTTKYNPARTWTAENSLGIGGAYMSSYGNGGPWRLPVCRPHSAMWNRNREVEAFANALACCVSSIRSRFYSGEPDELQVIRKEFFP